MCKRHGTKGSTGHGCCHHGHHKTRKHGPSRASWRKFVSKEERKEALEEYKEELKKELEAVNERLEEL